MRRYSCKTCLRSFSHATTQLENGQHKRHLNSSIRELLCSEVSQRDIARILQINPKTVARKLRYLALCARRAFEQQAALGTTHNRIYFDEMESFEHTKCKPLSMPIAVSGNGRKILSIGVAQMPAKGLLADLSRRKYGPRTDERAQVLRDLMQKIAPYAAPNCELISDKNPHYAPLVKRQFPQARHIQYKGRKPSDSGQGELRRKGFDPLFDLNHTCAMIRAHMSRLIRKTWCTTKKTECLLDHLWVYAHYHNTVLT